MARLMGFDRCRDISWRSAITSGGAEGTSRLRCARPATGCVEWHEMMSRRPEACSMSSDRALARVCAATTLMTAIAVIAVAQQGPPQFGGAYASLDARRQTYVHNWVERFNKATGQRLEAGPFYDDLLPLSTKTTFEAVTHALMT